MSDRFEPKLLKVRKPTTPLAWIFSGLLFCAVPCALANLGETLGQINARYGQPKKNLSARVNSGDKSASTYEYDLGGRIIFVEFIDGKSCSEAVRAAGSNPRFSEKEALALATQISGKTNWLQMNSTDEGIHWVSGDCTASLEAGSTPARSDFLFISTAKYLAHEVNASSNAAPPVPISLPPRNSTLPPTNFDMAIHTLEWHEQLASEGDPYGQYRMGLRYLKGDGVPQDVEKARDLLKSAAAQGDKGAAEELAKLPPAKVQASEFSIQSAQFGTVNKVVDVTEQVVKLLEARPEGFAINGAALHSDPAPGKPKRLTVHHAFQGKTNVLVLSAGKKLNYSLMAETASK